jgi:hypothetical protein
LHFLKGFFDYGYNVLERTVVSVLNKRIEVKVSSLSEVRSSRVPCSAPC